MPKFFVNGSTGDVNFGYEATGTTPKLTWDASAESVSLDSAVVINESGADVDFRVESDTNTHALFVDAGNNRVGILNSSPATALDVTGTVTADGLTVDAGNVLFKGGDISFYEDTGTTAKFFWDASAEALGLGTGSPNTVSGLTINKNDADAILIRNADSNFSSLSLGVSTTNSYTYIDSNNSGSGTAHPFVIKQDGSERMRIDGSGEVLVGGTTSLNASSGAMSLQRAGGGSFNLFRNDTSVVSGDFFGAINFWGNDTTSNTPTAHAYVGAVASGTHAAGDNPTDLVFGCTNDNSGTVAEFARLQSTSATGRGFYVRQPTLANAASAELAAGGGTAGTVNRYSSLGVFKHSGITNACSFLQLAAEDAITNYLWADNSDILRISTTSSNIGTTGGTVVGTQTSDERLKDISGPVTYGLNEVLAIEPIAFTMKDDPSIPKIGFSAQQVLPLVPEAVYDTKECIDGYTEDEETKEQIPNSDRTKLAMEYTQLIPVLVKAIQEQQAIIEALETRIAALESN